MGKGLDFRLNPLVDMLHEATSPEIGRRGFTEAQVTGIDPLMVQLPGVSAPVPALAVGPRPTQVGQNVLIYEPGAGRRYCMGVIS